MSNRATVELTKPAVASRLLKAAIRAYLRNDDPLATYLLASASARLLTDLREKRGEDWEETAIRDGIWYWAKFYDPKSYEGPQEILPLIIELSQLINQGKLSNSTDLNLTKLLPHQRAELRRCLNRPYNFLKHADRDFLASLGEDTFESEVPLAMACVSYQVLFPNADHEEAELYRYLSQRRAGRGFSRDLDPYHEAFQDVSEEDLRRALLRFLDFDPLDIDSDD